MADLRALTTVEQKAWRAFGKVADPPEHGKPGRTYSPKALLLIRWIGMRPGYRTIELSRVHRIRPQDVREGMVQLRKLDVAYRDPRQGWHLSATGQRLLELVDAENII